MSEHWLSFWKTSRVAALAALVWTLALAVSLSYNIWQRQRVSMDAAYADARAILNKDISFRRWATEHGGVYVPVTEKQQPVPWMAHLPGRDVITADGRHLTLLNPATMIRQVMDRYTAEFGIRGRITGLKALNPANLPDAWEAEELRAFERGERKEVWKIGEIGGQVHLRYLRAMYMEPGCEKCHAILGYKLGDLRGATGVSLPLAPYFERLQSDYLALGASHGIIWLLGLAGIGWIGRRAQGHERELRAQQRRVAKAELWYRTLFEQSPDGILIFDPATERFVDFNREAHEALGYTRDEFRAIRIADINPQESPELIASRIQRVNTLGNERFETRHRRKNGEMIDVQVVIQNMRADEAQYFLTSFRDITQQKKIESELADYRQHLEDLVARRTHDLGEKNQALEDAVRQLQSMQTQLVQAEKLASLGALVAGIAHELNTPIGNGRTVATTIADQTAEFSSRLSPDGPGIKRSDLAAFVERMTEGAQLLDRNLARAADLIHSFKQVAVDSTSSVRRDFDLKTVISDVLSTLHPRLKKTPFAIVEEIPPGIDFDSYPGPLGQVIMNLVENALVHGLDGRQTGCIRIAAEPATNGLVTLTVEDDGSGIPADNQARIFDPFFTTRLGRGGSGLGLNIVHNLVTNILGGKIAIHSDGKSGTRFTIRLPRRAPPGDAATR